MTIDEKIAEEKELAQREKNRCTSPLGSAEARKHEQLAEWLEDYKRIKQWKSDIMNDFCRYDVSSFEELIHNTKNKAINDFTNVLISRLTDAIYQRNVNSMSNLINEIAEQLRNN